MTERNYDVVIVGAGSMGTAAAYFLSKAGKKVLMIDAFDPPHSWGSHEGDTRLVSAASGEGEDFVKFTLRALELFDELQAESKEQLFMKVGNLTYGVYDSPFVENTLKHAKKFNIEHEYFANGQEMRDRWPDLTVEDDTHGVLEPQSGMLSIENVVRVYRRLAEQLGADILVNNPVHRVEIGENSFTAHTSKGTFTAPQGVVSVGAFSNHLLPQMNIDIKLEPARRAIGWFKADETFYSSDDFPTWYSDTPIGVYYGFPSLKGDGVKIGKFFDDPIHLQDPLYVNHDFNSFESDEHEMREYLAKYMPGANGPLLSGKVGIWTNSSDESYTIDFHPEHKHVIVAAGFSGNGAKVVPAVGEAIMEMLTKGESTIDLSPFSITREALKTPFSELKDSIHYSPGAMWR